MAMACDAGLLQLAHRLAHAFLVERLQHLAPRRHQPLRHRLAMAALDQRPVLPGDVLHDRVVLRPLVAADMQDVAIAAGRDHAGDGAVVLEDGVGGDGGAVEHRVDRLARNAVLVAKRHQAGDDAARGIVRGRGHLVDGRLAGLGVGIDQVRESAADVDADQPHTLHSLKSVARCQQDPRQVDSSLLGPPSTGGMSLSAGLARPALISTAILQYWHGACFPEARWQQSPTLNWSP